MPDHRLRASLLVGLSVAFASACVGGQAEVASPSSSGPVPVLASPRPTVAPNKAPIELPTPATSAAAPTPVRTTPTPETELEAILPDFVGADYTEKRPFSGAEMAAESGHSGGVVSRLFAATGATPEAFEGAEAHASRFGIFAIRGDGVDPGRLADAYIDAALAEHPGGTVSSRTVGGSEVRRIAWPPGTLSRDMHVMEARGIVFVASPFDDDDALVDAVFTGLFQPRFEEILPAEIGGRALVRYGMPGIALQTGGDMCSIVCPGEPNRLAAELGAPIEGVDLAVSYLDGADGVLIVAMRFKDVATDRLIAARVATSTRPDMPPAQRRELTIAGRPVTLVDYGIFGAYGSLPNMPEFLYARDDVLVILRMAAERDATIDTIVVPPILESAIKALP